jgi:hypothetical protein
LHHPQTQANLFFGFNNGKEHHKIWMGVTGRVMLNSSATMMVMASPALVGSV